MHPIQYLMRAIFGAAFITSSFFLKTVELAEKCIVIFSEDSKQLFIGENLKMFIITCIGIILVAIGAVLFVHGTWGLIRSLLAKLKKKETNCIILNSYPNSVFFGRIQTLECIIACFKKGEIKEMKMFSSPKIQEELTPGRHIMVKTCLNDAKFSSFFNNTNNLGEVKLALDEYFDKHGNKQYRQPQKIVLQKGDLHLRKREDINQLKAQGD